jgi:hypothetical protein
MVVILYTRMANRCCTGLRFCSEHIYHLENILGDEGLLYEHCKNCSPV